MARLERGFVTDYPDKSPPKSAKGFEWPSPRSVGGEQKVAFRKAFTQLLRTKAPDHRDFARQFYGQTRDGKGFIMPRNPGTIRKYADGDVFPGESKARQLAAFFKVPMERLLQDDGTPFEPLPLMRPNGAHAVRRSKKNGHGGNGTAGHPIVSHAAPAALALQAAPPRPPEGAEPLVIEIKTLPNASDWAHVNITGAVPLDAALGVIAFIERHKGGPSRK